MKLQFKMLFLLALLLSSCGQKGNLYLLEDNKEKIETSSDSN